jgi:hypothetical protein
MTRLNLRSNPTEPFILQAIDCSMIGAPGAIVA